VEGLALTKSLIDYLKGRDYISLITTHFEAVTEENDISEYAGTRTCWMLTFRKLDSELHIANRKERINIISRYMDYRLYTVTENREIPKDALNIAKMLGLNEEIIEGAKKYIK
jgi:DNA mismatch repair protein MutS2